MLKRFALASTALAALMGMAQAADLPRPMAPPPPIAPIFTWTGFYIGTHTGVITAEGDVQTRGNAANTIANVAANRRPASLALDSDVDLMSGAQIGYNLQFGSFVAGLEADISYAGLSTNEGFLSTLNDAAVFRRELDFFGTVRGRAGFAFDRVFVYATGGLAWGDVTNQVAFFRNFDRSLQFFGKSDEVEFGWTVGGGIEFALPPELQRFAFIGTLLGARTVTVKAEYLYYDLGDRDVLVGAIPGVGLNSYTSNFETRGHIGRVGINYKW